MLRHGLLCTKVVVLTLVLFINSHFCFAQSAGFPFGRVTAGELDMKRYEPDTSAVAVVLQEFGESYIENTNNYNLIHRYHVKIKILKKGGLSQGNFSILLRKNATKSELVRSVTGSSFNIENGLIRESKLDPKNLFTEDNGKYHSYRKFALPNVRVGSVIEVEYELESPFIQNFREWLFQSDIPKVYSEYWAAMPANYRYDILLRGFLKLTKNENDLVKDCLAIGGGKSECSRIKVAIKDIPAFIEEDYMTAPSNFLSGVYFELTEILYFDGRKDQLAKQWKDVEEELRRDTKFGLQLKRGGDIMDQHLEKVIAGETDPIKKANKIYAFIRDWYRWNEVYGEYSELGIKKAFDKKEGNVGDINLSLVAALRYAGLTVEPVLLSTRENGWLTEIHPVLSQFNYVIAKLNVNGKTYLLDATDDFLPFGMIPERCINGKGRVLGEKESYWHELKAPERKRSVSVQTLKMDDTGIFKGTIQNTYTGYHAMQERKKLYKAGNQKEFIDRMYNNESSLKVNSYKIENTEDDALPLIVKLEVELDAGAGAQDMFLINPFFADRWQTNPFKSLERDYPVDFGIPIEEIVVVNLEYPEGYSLVETPPKIGLALPDAGGRYLFNVQNNGNKLTVNSSLLISKPLFTSNEYHYLKELFGRVVATQQTDLLFKKQ